MPETSATRFPAVRTRAVAVAGRVAPRAVAWVAHRSGAAPSFADLLRQAEAHADRPGQAPESDPARPVMLDRELAAIGVRDLDIDGPGGPVPARLYQPKGPPVAGLVWVHGGGFISGTLNMAESHWVGLELARRGLAVLALDYRKAIRGTRYPAPLDDVAAGWQWAAGHADEALGVSPGRLHLGGASAGGTLAAGLASRLRDTPVAPAPRTLVLAYPMLHPDADSFPAAGLARLRRRSPYALMTLADMRRFAENYAGSPAMLTDPYAFPATGPLGGLPPVFVLTAEFDPLRFSGEAYAAAVTQAGGTATVTMVPRAPHGALGNPAGELGRRSLDRIAAWLLGGHC